MTITLADVAKYLACSDCTDFAATRKYVYSTCPSLIGAEAEIDSPLFRGDVEVTGEVLVVSIHIDTIKRQDPYWTYFILVDASKCTRPCCVAEAISDLIDGPGSDIARMVSIEEAVSFNPFAVAHPALALTFGTRRLVRDVAEVVAKRFDEFAVVEKGRRVVRFKSALSLYDYCSLLDDACEVPEDEPYEVAGDLVFVHVGTDVFSVSGVEEDGRVRVTAECCGERFVAEA